MSSTNCIYDSEGNKLYSKELKEIYGKSLSHINTLIRLYDVKTLKEFVSLEPWRKIHLFCGTIPDKHGNKLTIGDVAFILNRSEGWVREGMTRADIHNFEELKAYGETKALKNCNEFTGLGAFDRGKICYRDKFQNQCDHYRSCQDSRLSGKHHERYNPDGSCYRYTENYGARASSGSTTHTVVFANHRAWNSV